MLSAQSTVLGPVCGGPITNWFNPSIAHQHYCSSNAIFENLSGLRAQYVPNGIGGWYRDRDTKGLAMTTTYTAPAGAEHRRKGVLYAV